MGELKHVTSLPKWLDVLKDDGQLNSRDVAALFGFRSTHGIHKAIAQGRFPPPDRTARAQTARFKPRLLWYKKTVLKEIERRNNEANPRSKS